ncbi:exodeoxyribonuclease III [Ruania halotolerans]|uniref:exodeoxyribonuclease III n=1 Tax=Ruania halotolerans TaxID=2897773 RepID=UPI001E5C2E4B|nr:exodeoxyribonuclease III [Ruania halotolerans]UFU06060.1 exodeoxyribonuclease III [Ruania halotolerans]
MRIASWNVNSIRARAERVTAWLERNDVDVLLVQETKTKDETFPYLPFQAAGYEVAHHGLNQWNGVAICSRVGLTDVAHSFPGQPGWGEGDAMEARAIGATCAGLRLWSVYVPNGRTLEDPHYTYKLRWLDALREAAAGWAESGAPVGLLGDWNVAPRDEDVWDIAVFEGSTHVSAAERAAFDAFADAGYREVTREHLPQVYTYWDYQRLRFPKNEGMRIDFAWATAALADRVRAVAVDREERKGKGASDHVPVVLDVE